MPHEPVTCDRRALRVRLAAEPASVPGARRFVADGLRAWGHHALVDDATLCVSELAGNAALHASSSYIEVCVLELEQVVRLWVEDDGAGPVTSIAPRTSLPAAAEGPDAGFGEAAGLDDLEVLLDAPATGRGLAIVSVLASDWGVEELDNGKRVWADLAPVDRTEDDLTTERAPATAPLEKGTASLGEDNRGDALPEGWVVVTLRGCPVELSLLQDQHLDELVRELTLISLGGGREEAAELGHRLEAILRAPAQARDSGRRQAKAALAAGQAFIDVEMAMPRAFSQEVRELHEAVKEADALCEQQRLLTLASRPEIRDFREWMTAEIVGQIERNAEPTAWLDWLSARH